MTADSLARFAAIAGAFVAWARDGTDAGEAAARNALLHLTRLYAAALELPPDWDGGLADGVEDEEWRAVFRSVGRRLPFDYYGVVFNPFEMPPETEPVIGQLADDVADIYRDVVCGLSTYREHGRAGQYWVAAFGNHWGYHATSAIRVLHEWLATYAPERLADDPPG